MEEDRKTSFGALSVKKVLYLVEDTESAQFRYRVENIKEALGNSTEWRVDWVLKSEIKKIKFDDVDLIIILRQTAKDKEILNLIDSAHKCDVKVLFDLDDLIFAYKDLPILIKGTNSKNIFYWAGYIWGIRRIAKRVDGFIATNDFLGKKLKRSFSKPVATIPNSLNKDQVELSDKLIKKKKESKDFWVGYFSGSPTHVKDFAMVEPELIRFLEEHDNAKLRVVGYMEFSEKIKRLIDNGKVEVLEFTDYLKLEELVSGVDVNIAPLVINDFTNCKSELKFFEAAVVETTTIASPSYTFKKAISDGTNGFLVKTGEWCDKLEYLYNNPSESQKIAKKARNYALKNYYGEKFLKEVEEAYGYFEKKS